FAGEGQALFAEGYRLSVRYFTSAVLWGAYDRAALAALCQGFPEQVQAELEGLALFHWRNAARLEPRGLMGIDFLDPDDKVAAMCCALPDARTALGIEDRGREPLTDLWRAFAEECAETGEGE